MSFQPVNRLMGRWGRNTASILLEAEPQSPATCPRSLSQVTPKWQSQFPSFSGPRFLHLPVVVEGDTFPKVVVRIKQNNTQRGLGMVPGSEGTTFTYGSGLLDVRPAVREVGPRARLRMWAWSPEPLCSPGGSPRSLGTAEREPYSHRGPRRHPAPTPQQEGCLGADLSWALSALPLPRTFLWGVPRVPAPDGSLHRRWFLGVVVAVSPLGG